MTTPSALPVKPGDVLRVAEVDYMYGLGPLVLRVEEVGTTTKLPDGVWISVRGVEIRWDGADGDKRVALVRLSGGG